MRKTGFSLLGLAIGLFSAMPVQAADTAPAVTVSTAPVPATAAPHRSGLNELKGKFQSKNEDPMALRIMVDGGYNVEFAYDAKTVMINGGSPITANDLNYGDVLVIHYAGKELYAVDIDRVSKAESPL